MERSPTVTQTVTVKLKAWLLLAAGGGPVLTRDDDPSRHYSWDSTVQNYKKVAEGNLIVLWDKKQLLGASLVESISITDGHKIRYRCPNCDRTNIRERKEKRPRYRCADCHNVFNERDEETINVTVYRSTHGALWVDLKNQLPINVLRSLCDNPRSQLSIRPFHWQAFMSKLREASVPND